MTKRKFKMRSTLAHSKTQHLQHSNFKCSESNFQVRTLKSNSAVGVRILNFEHCSRAQQALASKNVRLIFTNVDRRKDNCALFSALRCTALTLHCCAANSDESDFAEAALAIQISNPFHQPLTCQKLRTHTSDKRAHISSSLLQQRLYHRSIANDYCH